MKLGIDPNQVKGFLEKQEAESLYQFAKKYSSIGPCLEIGSYCGKSAVYLGAAVKENNQILYSIDHHKGSEEQQPGEEFFDPDLLDETGNKIYKELKKLKSEKIIQNIGISVYSPDLMMKLIRKLTQLILP